MANEEGRMRCTIGGIDHWQDGDGTWWYREDHKARVATLAMMPYLDALAAAQAENARMREEIAAMMRYDAQSTELLDWLMAHLSFQEWQRLGVPDPRRPRTRSDLLAARSYALAAQEGTR